MNVKNGNYFFTSESVTEGHPDKICDQISDAVLDAAIREDKDSRVACECSVSSDLVILSGEITSTSSIDYLSLVRDKLRDIGYTDKEYGVDAETCSILVALNKQSPDIAMGVNEALESREGQMKEVEIEAIGAGDQGMMFGFACSETPELMPLPISLSQDLARRLSKVRKDRTIPYLRPDGKVQVTVEYEETTPVRVDTIVVSTQHHPEVTREQIIQDVKKYVISDIVPAHLIDNNTKYYINPTGRFVIGGPHGDAGLTGRKIIVDTYGGYARHGGGAFSGKDPTKVDRSAAYAARYVAKNIVAAGLAERCEVQLAYSIGVATPVSIMVDTFGTGKIGEEKMIQLIRQHFDLRPAGIIKMLNLRQPIYSLTACYGHFGRKDVELPWELTDKAKLLKNAL